MRMNFVVICFLFFAIQSAIFSVENRNSKELPSANSTIQSRIKGFPPLTDKLSVGEIACGFRKNNVTIPLLNKMKMESVSFQTQAAKDFFLLVFRGIPDSSSILLSLPDYKLINDDSSVSRCKGFNALFTASAINNGGSFYINDSVGFRYGGDGEHELFSCLLFVIDKHAKNLRLLYRNQISEIIPELDPNTLERKALYYKKESPDFSLTSLTDMVYYDEDSFALYGAYSVQNMPVASSFSRSREVEINDIARYTEDLIIATVTLKNNSCASDDSLVLDKTFRAAIQIKDSVWIDSKGVVLEFDAGGAGPEKSYQLCNYVKEANNLKFVNSSLLLAKGTEVKDIFFQGYLNCHINKIKSNAFRTVIPLVFQITEDKKIAAFKFSDFSEIQLAGFDLLSKINREYVPSHYKNSLTVINKTGKVAFVKIENITTNSIAEFRIIADDDNCTFFLPNGQYKEYVRLGCTSPYQESKGEETIELSAPDNQYVEAFLTLHSVENGNHLTKECAAGEFDAIGR